MSGLSKKEEMSRFMLELSLKIKGLGGYGY